MSQLSLRTGSWRDSREGAQIFLQLAYTVKGPTSTHKISSFHHQKCGFHQRKMVDLQFIHDAKMVYNSIWSLKYMLDICSYRGYKPSDITGGHQMMGWTCSFGVPLTTAQWNTIQAGRHVQNMPASLISHSGIRFNPIPHI